MRMRIMPNKVELTLEQSQQGVSNDVLVSIEGVEHPNAFDEYLQMSEHTARDALFFFNMCIIELYMPKYLRKPTLEDVLFDDLLDDLAHVVPYVVNGVQYRNGYYLADGIYPEWASFVKSFTVATDPKHTSGLCSNKKEAEIGDFIEAFFEGIDIANMINDESFAQLYDDDAVGLCCLGILQLVILGVESTRVVPDWMLRLANDRVCLGHILWGVLCRKLKESPDMVLGLKRLHGFIEFLLPQIAWVCSYSVWVWDLPGDLCSRLNVFGVKRFKISRRSYMKKNDLQFFLDHWSCWLRVSTSVCLMIMKQQQEDYNSRLQVYCSFFMDLVMDLESSRLYDILKEDMAKINKCLNILKLLKGIKIVFLIRECVSTVGYVREVVYTGSVIRYQGKLQHDDKGFVDSGCSRHITGNIAYLSDFKQFDGGYVAFGGGAYGGKISGKGTLKTANLDFKDVYFVNELKFNLFSVSQMCDKKNYVLFIDIECLVLSPNFKFLDENQILLKIVVGPTFVSSLMHKKYCLVVTDDYSRFTWVFFLTTKDETSEILKRFIKEIENLVDKKVKIIRSDNGTEFKNKVMDDFCREKGIKREYSVARTPQQNGVAERRNMTLIEAARTMLADSKLPTTFWAEAVSTACYALSFMRPFGCHVTILNTLDSLGKFDGKSDEGFFIGYSLSSKAFKVKFSNVFAGTVKETSNKCIVMPIWKDTSYFDSPTENVDNGEPKTADDAQKQDENGLNNKNDEQERFANDSSSKDVTDVGQQVNTASLDVNTGSIELNVVGPSVSTASSNEKDNTKEEPKVDLGNITNSYIVPNTPNTRIHKDHPIDNMIGEIEPTSITKALSDSSWVEAMQEELLQFKLQQVILVDLPNGKKANGTKWVFRNKKDEKGIVIRNKASAFLYGTIEEEVYVTQPPRFKDPDHPDKVYKVVKALYGLHQAPRAWYETLANYLLNNGFKRGKIDQTLFIKKQKGDILLVQDGDVDDVNVDLYRSVIGSLMYLTASRPDIMFTVCACARFQVTPKTSHLLAIKRIFRYLKGKPTLGLWYSRDSPFELVAYSDSDYAGATQDRKSTNGGCQFLGNRLISWQCKKQTVVATSTTEAEYVAAANCCGQNASPFEVMFEKEDNGLGS
ncbi:putative ribonuclease H-like domain-containing protein [Tanacetum coccineum]